MKNNKTEMVQEDEKEVWIALKQVVLKFLGN